MVIEHAPLEDELGDVLDKAIQHSDMSEQSVAEKAGVELDRILDAIDYRYDLSDAELGRLAKTLDLNAAGLLALAHGCYPLPEIAGLPFCLFPLRIVHGIGVANAYVIADCTSQRGLLFDAGCEFFKLRQVWPKRIRSLEAVFITHAETEHMGGLEGVRAEFDHVTVFAPEAKVGPCVVQAGQGTRLVYSDFEIEVLPTPGHVEAHNCYVVKRRSVAGPAVLFAGDLIFAGSVGGAYFCRERMVANLRRMLWDLPEDTVIAPGHGPLTTIKHERMFNPFVT